MGLFAGAAVAALLAFPGLASANVTSAVNGGVLTVTSDAGDGITITDHAGALKINGQDPGSGAATSASITSIQVTGDAGPNNINLAAVTGTAFTALTSVNVDGAGGNDLINGSQLADVLKGGGDNDRIIGDDNQPGTDDDMRGEAGNDTLVWNPGDDDDINEGGPGSDTSEVNGGGKEQFEVNPSATQPGRVSFDRVQPNGDLTFGAPFNVDISDDTEKLDLNAGGGDDIVNAASGLDALAFALDINGGDLNDVIDGGDGADLIDGAAGDDQIAADNNPLFTRDNVNGGPGNDTMTWNPGDGDDVNEGGDDNDTVVVNGGSVDEDFRVKPSSTPGRVSFDRTGPTPPGPFNIDIGSSENLVLNAGDGNDEIKGSKGLAGLIDSTFNGDGGRDRIKGTDGDDLLQGGAGGDVIRSRDKSADQVEGDGGFDIAFVDRRDTVRAVEIVLGGSLKVKASAKSVNVTGGVAALTLKCVATKQCKGLVKLRLGGKTLAGAKFKMGKNKSATVRLKLNKRGLRLLANASQKGLKVQLRIDAKDGAKNGWRTDSPLRLKA